MAYENVILVIILMGTVFFGAKKLPELAKSLGRAQTEFEKARIEARRELVSSYGKNHDNNENDGHAGTFVQIESPSASLGEVRIPQAGNNDNPVSTTIGPKVSESANSSLVVTAEAGSSDNDDIDRTKLQNAAKKIGIENPEKLSDAELRSAIRNNLGL
jgi:sec-independent protein translocase protein TatA